MDVGTLSEVELKADACHSLQNEKTHTITIIVVVVFLCYTVVSICVCRVH